MSKGWQERVAELATLHGPMVFGTAYRILGDVDDARDVQQDVFLNLLSSWVPRLKASRVTNWGGYLRVAATRSAITLLRRRRRGNDVFVPLEEGTADGKAPDPRRDAINRQRAEMLRAALAELPEREAQVFALRFFEELSYADIAEQTRLSASRVGVLIHRARKRLRAKLEPCLGDACRPASQMPDRDLRDKERSHVA